MPIEASVGFTFVLDNLGRDWPDLESLDESDIASQPARFVGGRNSWVAQGYLRLRDGLAARGHVVRLSACALPGTICIVHRDDLNRFSPSAHAAFLVVIRADRAPVVACDVAIAQNGLHLRANERFIPLWPQPGLQARNAGRACRVRRIVYHGRTGSIPMWFRDLSSSTGLAKRGVKFESRVRGWEDYRDADLVLAAREDARTMLEVKPATKVYNGWLAGVPVLAAPEPAYRELRRSHLDFLEVEGARDVISAIDRLNGSPALYRAMVANGQARGRGYDVDATRSRWLALIDDEILPAFLNARPLLGTRRGWFRSAMLRQKTLSRTWRARLCVERFLVRLPSVSARVGELLRLGSGSGYALSHVRTHEGANGTFR